MNELNNQFIKLSSKERLHQLPIPIVGLTGGIGSGKSTVADILEKKSIPVICADRLVHQIYRLPETLDFLQQLSPTFIKEGNADMAKIRQQFFSDPNLKRNIEGFIYAKLPEAFTQELKKIQHPRFVVYDIPLLFERKLQAQFDCIICVYIPRQMQIERIQKRNNGLTAAEIENFLNNQIDIEIKKDSSDLVISNTGNLAYLAGEIDRVLDQLLLQPSKKA